ncbi:MAG: MFS transporter, partial [Candidatus Micrarchaeota archaeon]|nr:MFS transporter [Candidatus Micrarchaeota archaeon]
KDSIWLLVMGTVKSGGRGCLCPESALLSALLGIALAALSDHLGRRALISLYSVASAFGTAIMAFIQSPVAFVSGRAISSMAGSNQWNLMLARVSDLSGKEHRATKVGLYIAAFALSYSISHIIVGAIIDGFGFPVAFAVTIAAALACAATALLFLDVGKRKHRFHLSLNVLKTMDGKLNMVVSFCTGFTSIISMYVLYIFLARQSGFDATGVGLFIAATYIFWAIFSYLFGPLIDRKGVKKMMFVGAVMNASAWFAAIYFQDFLPFFALMVVDNITWPLYGLSAMKISTVLPEQENMGRDVSIFGFANMMGTIAASFLGGILAEMSFGYVFAARAAAILLSGCIVFFLMKVKD